MFLRFNRRFNLAKNAATGMSVVQWLVLYLGEINDSRHEAVTAPGKLAQAPGDRAALVETSGVLPLIRFFSTIG